MNDIQNVRGAEGDHRREEVKAKVIRNDNDAPAQCIIGHTHWCCEVIGLTLLFGLENRACMHAVLTTHTKQFMCWLSICASRVAGT